MLLGEVTLILMRKMGEKFEQVETETSLRDLVWEVLKNVLRIFILQLQ